MQRRGLFALAAATLLGGRASSSDAADPAPSVAPSGLAELAVQGRERGVPVLLFFTMPGCPYCAEVRRSYLAPRISAQPPALLLREIDITSAAPLADFDGARLTAADLALRYGVRLVPVVIAVDGTGRPIGEPLVGLDRAGFYEGRLQALLDRARAGR
jgi:hypothetical protein